MGGRHLLAEAPSALSTKIISALAETDLQRGRLALASASRSTALRFAL